MLKTNLISTVNVGNGVLVLKYEGKGFRDKYKYLTLPCGVYNKCFSDMNDGKENFINDTVNTFLKVTDETVDRVEIYGIDVQDNYKSNLILEHKSYKNVIPSVSLIFGLIGNSDFFVNEDLLINEKKAKRELELLPDKDYMERSDYKKLMKEDLYKRNKKVSLDEAITFKNIKDFKYKLKPKHVFNEGDYKKMLFTKDEDIKDQAVKNVSFGVSSGFLVISKVGQISRFSCGEKEFVLEKAKDEIFELKSCFDASEKRHDIFALLEKIINDYKIKVEEIYFETDIDKINNEKEIYPYTKNTFVKLTKGSNSGIVYADDLLPLFLHFQKENKNVNIKINKGDYGGTAAYT
ncbi:MAG: hypothetical protein JSV92_01255 [archaeon]|nr:MAG: hypothetical protein JSV92_01255 [archaeon]